MADGFTDTVSDGPVLVLLLVFAGEGDSTDAPATPPGPPDPPFPGTVAGVETTDVGEGVVSDP